MNKKARKAIIRTFSNEFPVVFFVASGLSSYPLGRYLLLRARLEHDRKCAREKELGFGIYVPGFNF